MILDQLKDAGGTKTLERFGVRWHLAKLDGKQRDTKGTPDGRRKFPQVPAARSDPDELFRLEFIHAC
jgi:hypothetical protein